MEFKTTYEGPHDGPQLKYYIQHFNSAGHSITDVLVQGLRLCRGSNLLCKQLEMRLIFQLGTVQPDGPNINFKYV